MATTKSTRTPDVSAESDNAGLTLTFANGQTLRILVSQLTPEIGFAAMMHGLKQKLIDAAAISRNPDTGASATLDDKYQAVREVYDRITSPDGTWNKIREGGTGATGGLLLAALMRLRPGKAREDLQAWLDGKTKEELAALRASATIAPVIEAIKAERAARNPDVKAVNVDDMLGELDD